VHCARQEPFGRVLLEAAAAGCPIIATAVGGTEEMLVDGESAMLVHSDDPVAIADAMVRSHDDRTLRERLGTAARDRAAPRFSIDQSARGLAEVWRSAL
jgi:glycosyltransferase involved in cell wall biosynthesis